MSKKIQQGIEFFLEHYYSFIFYLVALASFSMFFLVILQVLFRYVLNFSIFWIEEMARYMMFFMVVFGATLAFKNDIHPRMLKFNSLYWEILLRLIIFYYLSIFIRNGWQYANRYAFMSTPGLGISYFWPYVIIPLGGLSMFILLFVDTISVLFFKKSYFKRQ